MSNSLCDIQILLEKAGQNILQEPFNTREIREFQRNIRDCRSINNKEISFLLFFMPIFIDDVFFNLVGDIVGINAEILEKTRNDLFSFMGNSLINMSRFLGDGKKDRLYNEYEALVSFYLEKVNYLNSLSFSQQDPIFPRNFASGSYHGESEAK